MITQAFNIDLVPGFRPQTRQTSQQGDKGGSRVFSIAIENAGQSFAIPDEATVVILGTKPSGTGFAYDTDSDPDIITKTETGVTVALSAQMTCVPGDVICGLIIKLGAETLGSASFVMDVRRRALSEETIIDRDDFSSTLTAAVWDLFNELTEEQAAQIRDKLGIDEGGSGGSATVVVTIDDTTDPVTASMTAAEVKAAVDRKERVVLSISGYEIPYLTYIGQTVVFSKVIDIDTPSPVCMMIIVDSAKHVLPSMTYLAQTSDIPTQQQMAEAAVFIAVRGTTTEAEIREAHDAGKVVICVYQNRVYYLSDDGTTMFCTVPDAQGKVYALVVTGSLWTGINYNLALTSDIPTKTSQLSNDSIKTPYYLTVTDNGGTITVDKTPTEIDALSVAGYDVHMRLPMTVGEYTAVGDMRYFAKLYIAAFYGLVWFGNAPLIATARVTEQKLVHYELTPVVTEGDIIRIENALTDKADKSDIPSLTGYVTETWVQNQGYQTAQDVQTAVSGKADKTPRIAKASTDTTATLNPNTLYVFPEMASLTITLATPTDLSIVNEYHFIFSSGATATVLTLPDDLIAPDGELINETSWKTEANQTYEVSILEGRMLEQHWGYVEVKA